MTARRAVVVHEPCVHGTHLGPHYTDESESIESLCKGGPHRVLSEGSYVLVEKVDGQWPERAKQAVAAATEWKAHAPEFSMHGYTIRQTVLDILDAIAQEPT